MQGVQVRSMVRELRYHMPNSQTTKTQNRSNIVTNSIDFKNGLRKKKFLKERMGIWSSELHISIWMAVCVCVCVCVLCVYHGGRMASLQVGQEVQEGKSWQERSHVA